MLESTFRQLLAVPLLVSLLLAVGCNTIKVHVDETNQLEPEQYQRYAWKFAPQKDDDGRNNALVMLDSAVRKAVNQQLQDRDYQLTNTKDAEFTVVYQFHRQALGAIDAAHATTQDATKAWVESSGMGVVDHPRQRYESFGAYEDGYLELIVEAPDGKRLWRAEAHKLIEDFYPDQQSLDKSMHEAFRKMMRSFPNAKQ